MADLPFEVGGHPFEPANGHGFVSLQPPAPAGGLAGTVTGAPQDAGKDVGLPVQHVGVGVAPLGNHPDILRHVRVRRAGPLAIDNLMEVIGISGIGGFHPRSLAPNQPRHGAYPGFAIAIAAPAGRPNETELPTEHCPSACESGPERLPAHIPDRVAFNPTPKPRALSPDLPLCTLQ